MKKLLLIALALLTMGVSVAQNNQIRTNNQINTLIVNTSGDVTLRQDVTNESNRLPNSNNECLIEDSALILNGSDDLYVIMAGLEHLIVNASGDVTTSGDFRGKDLEVVFNSSGDTKLDLNYDNVNAYMNGSGDLVLRGKCNNLYVENNGSGDVNLKRMDAGSKNITLGGVRHFTLDGLAELLEELGLNLERLTDSVDWENFARDMEQWGEDMEEWGRHMEEWGDQVGRQMEGRRPRQPKDRRPEQWGQGTPDVVPQPDVRPEKPQPRPKEPEKRSLLMDPHWAGVDFGLNMLFGPGTSANFEGDYSFLELKPLKSWNFNFNIADVGLAFDRKHTAGIYTGIGLGWNNYSFNQPVRLIKGDEHLEGQWIDETVEGPVKKSKLGVLYVQAPLMLEICPARGFFFSAGVVGGVRVDSWTKVKFEDRYKEKHHGNYYLNPLKLDAALRAGGEDFGFYASFDLLPEFVEPNGPTAHAFNVGFTMIF